MAKKSEYILCLSPSGYYVCEIANQSGRGFLINATEYRFHEHFTWENLENAIKKIEKKSQIKRIILSSEFYNHQSLKLYYLKESSKLRSAEFEFYNLIYGTSHSEKYEYNVKFFEDSHQSNISAFYINNSKFAKLMNIFRKYQLSNAEILITPPLFIHKCEKFLTQTTFVGAQIDTQAMTLVARGEENFSATPCRNFSHATRLERCKRNFDATSIGIDYVNLPLCSYFAFLCFCVFVKTSVRAYNNI